MRIFNNLERDTEGKHGMARILKKDQQKDQVTEQIMLNVKTVIWGVKAFLQTYKAMRQKIENKREKWGMQNQSKRGQIFIDQEFQKKGTEKVDKAVIKFLEGNFSKLELDCVFRFNGSTNFPAERQPTPKCIGKFQNSQNEEKILFLRMGGRNENPQKEILLVDFFSPSSDSALQWSE